MENEPAQCAGPHLDVRKPKLEEMAAHLVNLAWNGLSELDPKPKLSPQSTKLLRDKSKF